MTNAKITNTNHYFRMLGTLAVLASLLIMAVAARPAHASTPFVVNSAGDQPDANTVDGVCLTLSNASCTLRAAIQQANANSGPDQITFKVPSSFAFMQPNSPLPTITEQTSIDGYFQTDSSPNTLAQGDNAGIRVQIDGSNAGSTSGRSFQ